MLDHIVVFLENASIFAIFNQISSMSTTDVVMVFLASKSVFLAAGVSLVAVKPARQRVSGWLECEATDPLLLFEEPPRKQLPRT